MHENSDEWKFPQAIRVKMLVENFIALKFNQYTANFWKPRHNASKLDGLED